MASHRGSWIDKAETGDVHILDWDLHLGEADHLLFNRTILFISPIRYTLLQQSYSLFPSKNWIKNVFLNCDSILRKTKDRRLPLNSFRQIPKRVENCQQLSAEPKNCKAKRHNKGQLRARVIFPLLVYRDSRIGQSRPISAAIKVFSSQDLAS